MCQSCQLGQSRFCCINEDWKRPWCWERLKARGEGDDRGRDGWVAPLTQFWASSARWTGKDRGAWHAAGCGVSESAITEELNNSSNEQLSYLHDFSHKSAFLTPGMTEAFSSRWRVLPPSQGKGKGAQRLVHCLLELLLKAHVHCCLGFWTEASDLAGSRFRQAGRSVVLWV